MYRSKSKAKWQMHADAYGYRKLLATYPAWKYGDLVEIIGTGLTGMVVKETAMDFSRWLVLLGPGGESEVEVGAREMRVPV